jgi:hypothetical protein
MQCHKSSARNLRQKTKELVLYIHGVYVIPGKSYKILDNLHVAKMSTVLGGNHKVKPPLCLLFVMNDLSHAAAA